MNERERVDVERLRESVRHVGPDGWSSVRSCEVDALLAVVDAARDGVRAWSEGAYADIDCGSLEAALEPFGPSARDLAVKAAVDATKGNPRDRARDQLADAGVVVQRQFRLDQERIAELEAELAEARKWQPMWRDEIKRALDAVEERDALRKRVAELERQLEAERTRGIDHALYEMVCAERDGLEARLARVPALVETVRRFVDADGDYSSLVAALAAWEKP